MITDLKLKSVHYIPKHLEPGILYYSKEFKIAAHLCACGCGNKIVTPLGPTDWELTVHKEKPSLYPSIGNWQIPCRSHYWVKDGIIRWSYQWTDEQILVGRKNEEARRKIYYKNSRRKEPKLPFFKNMLIWLFKKSKKD